MSDSDDIDDMLDEYDFSDGQPNPYAEELNDDEMNIASWNYRLLVGEDGLLTVGEVYYDSENKPVAWRPEAASPLGENVEEIISTLKLMLDATQKPVFTPPKGDANDTARD